MYLIDEDRDKDRDRNRDREERSNEIRSECQAREIIFDFRSKPERNVTVFH